jgi:hypothetical protein
MRFLALTIVLAIAISTTSEAKKVRLGQDTTLECHKVPKCEWYGPNIVLDFGKDKNKTHNDFRSEWSEEKCILFFKASETVAGEWACDKGGVQKEGHQNITLEVVPGELEVTIPENPFEDMENETDLELNYELSCVAKNTISKPKFIWSVDEQILELPEVENETSNSWTQTVTYAPLEAHAEKTLKCEAQFDDNDEDQEPKKMAEIVLGFTERHIQKMANNTKNLNNTDDVEDEEYFFQTKYDIIAILIVVSITSLCLTIYCMWWFRLGCFKNWQPPTQGPYAQTTEEVDAENPKESETETEKADSTKEEKESTEELTKVVKPTLGERMSSFFRMNKNSAEEKIVENLDKPDDALTEVVIDNKKIGENGIEDNKVDGKGDVEKKLEKSEEKTTNEDETEEKSNQDDNQTTEDTEKLVKGKFRNFFVKLFTKKDTVADKKSEEPVKMSNCETKEEFEPEDKPEIPEEDQKLKPEVVETETTKLTEPKEEEQLPKTVLASETSF